MEKHGSDDELFGLDETCLPLDEDEEANADADHVEAATGQPVATDDHRRPSSYDEVLLHRLRNALSGVPPPPLVTYPRQSVDEILRALRSLRDDADRATTAPPDGCASDAPAGDRPSALRACGRVDVETILAFWRTLKRDKRDAGGHDCDERKCDSQINRKLACKSPRKSTNDCQSSDVADETAIEERCAFYDVGYNISDLSEKIAALYDKYRERYVGCETSSFVTANSPSKYFGKKNEKRKLIGRSPARRTVFPRARRKIFSSSSLQAASKDGIFGLEKRTILIDNPSKKKDDKQTRRALFLSPEERTNMRLDILKQSPGRLKSIEMRRSLWMRRKYQKRSTPAKQTPKKHGTPRKQRTPGKGTSSSSKLTPRKYGTPAKSTPRKGGTSSKHRTPKKSTPRRSVGVENSRLNAVNVEDASCADEINENGKRRRTDDVLPAAEPSTICSADENDLALENRLELSDTQRRKLLWAVSAALKQAGIGSAHCNFRLCGKKLYKICKNIWTNRSTNRNVKAGISEQMLSLATEYVTNVIREVEDEGSQSSTLELWSQDSNSCDFFFQHQQSQR